MSERHADRQHLIRIAQRWLRFWQGGDLSNFNEVHAPQFVDQSSSGRSMDRDGFRQGIVGLYSAFPDFHGVAEDFIVDEAASKVALPWTATGTHRGTFLGVAPTHRRIRFQGIEIIQIEGDRVVRRWGEWDGIEILRQIETADT